MKLEELRVDLYRVLPIGHDRQHAIDSGALVPDGAVAADWPPIDQRKQTWGGKGRPEVEPGENDEYCCDFFISTDEQVVFVYAYLGNAAKQRGKHKLGWLVTSFYDLAGPSGGQSTDNFISEEAL